jgi:hypothetical protein
LRSPQVVYLSPLGQPIDWNRACWQQFLLTKYYPGAGPNGESPALGLCGNEQTPYAKTYPNWDLACDYRYSRYSQFDFYPRLVDGMGTVQCFESTQSQ